MDLVSVRWLGERDAGAVSLAATFSSRLLTVSGRAQDHRFVDDRSTGSWFTRGTL